MATLFNLFPYGMDSITFGTRDVDSASSGYYAPSADYRFNENQRIDIIYSDTVFGGKAISEKQNLVPVNFTVFVIGLTRDQLMDRAQVLNRAIMNSSGGELEYRPEGATISTYYRFEKSKPAIVQEIKTNLWDAITFENNRYVIALSVELMTHPVATSGDPVSVTISRSNLFTNTYIVSASNQTYNFFEIYDIKGDLPAIVHLSMMPGTSMTLNRVYLWSRSSRQSVLSELKLNYEANSASSSGNWTSQVASGPTGNNFMRCAPTDFTTWHKLRFTIPNEAEHRGFASIFISMRKSNFLPYFRVRLGYEVGNVRIWTSNTSYTTSTLFENVWHWEYVGDIQMPPLGISIDQELSSPQLVVELQQVNGDFDRTFDIDTMQIVFSDLSAIQVNIGDESAQSTGSSFIERVKTLSTRDFNCVGQIQTVGSVYKRSVTSIYGSPLGILAEDDTKIFMMFERATTDGDLYSTSDFLQFTAQIIYRTIFPFGS